MTTSPQRTRCCRTCGQLHPHVPGMHSNDCVLIGGRTHGRSGRRGSEDSFPSSDRLITIPMPTSIREQAMLFDQIWFWFIDMKHENDDARSMLSQYSVDKGTLRAAAPMLWLEWKRWDDLRGQTRNQENFDKAWQNFVYVTDGCGRRTPVAWLTLRSMPARPESPPRSPPFMPSFVTT
jgi:hypothetical protein